PSNKFVTQPATPSREAASWTNQRKPPPCTRPLIPNLRATGMVEEPDYNCPVFNTLSRRKRRSPGHHPTGKTPRVWHLHRRVFLADALLSRSLSHPQLEASMKTVICAATLALLVIPLSAAAHGRRDKHYEERVERVPARGEAHVVFSRGDVGLLRED